MPLPCPTGLLGLYRCWLWPREWRPSPMLRLRLRVARGMSGHRAVEVCFARLGCSHWAVSSVGSRVLRDAGKQLLGSRPQPTGSVCLAVGNAVQSRLRPTGSVWRSQQHTSRRVRPDGQCLDRSFPKRPWVTKDREHRRPVVASGLSFPLCIADFCCARSAGSPARAKRWRVRVAADC